MKKYLKYIVYGVSAGTALTLGLFVTTEKDEVEAGAAVSKPTCIWSSNYYCTSRDNVPNNHCHRWSGHCGDDDGDGAEFYKEIMK